MAFRNFRLHILYRIVAVVLLMFVTLWSYLHTEWQITPLVSGLLAVLITIDLIRYVERTSREFTSFLEFIYHHDFSVNIANRGKGRVFSDLGNAYKLITGEYQRLNLEREAHYQYLEAVVEHISVALVCLDDDGSVKLINRQAKKLFKAPYLPTVYTFNRVDERLPGILLRLSDGERQLVEIQIEDEALQLMLYATEFQLLDQDYKLVSFQNIRDELEQREIDSWQKLIRVLTHEIMNSVTPIISLTSVIRDLLMPEDGARLSIRELSADEHQDLLRSIRSIESRSRGLQGFVQAYSNLSNLPAPVFGDVDVPRLLQQARSIMRPELERAGVHCEVEYDALALTVRADADMLEQVLINLIKNAIEALDGRPRPGIRLLGFVGHQDKVLLQVIDNGPGIDPAHMDDIFVPFFTTKRNGSGVGLSISRQIMFVNKGLLSVQSAPGEGCVFTLRFN